jgi:hypothetical protein
METFVQFAFASQLCGALVILFVQNAVAKFCGVALASRELFPSPPAFSDETT